MSSTRRAAAAPTVSAGELAARAGAAEFRADAILRRRLRALPLTSPLPRRGSGPAGDSPRRRARSGRALAAPCRMASPLPPARSAWPHPCSERLSGAGKMFKEILLMLPAATLVAGASTAARHGERTWSLRTLSASAGRTPGSRSANRERNAPISSTRARRSATSSCRGRTLRRRFNAVLQPVLWKGNRDFKRTFSPRHCWARKPSNMRVVRRELGTFRALHRPDALCFGAFWRLERA
jgi:hypothetical protein